MIQQHESVHYSEREALTQAKLYENLGYDFVMLEQVNMLAWRVVSWVVL